jgi:hypothetical protein
MSIFGLRYPVAVVVCALGGLAVLLPSVRAAERDEPVVVPDAAGRVQAVVDSLRDRLTSAKFGCSFCLCLLYCGSSNTSFPPPAEIEP